MLRVIVYLIAVLKLLWAGKWYPPAHVLDVSAADYAYLEECVAEFSRRLYELEKQAEATRKKVYREEAKESDEIEVNKILQKAEPQPAIPEQALGGMQAGDEVPVGVL